MRAWEPVYLIQPSIWTFWKHMQSRPFSQPNRTFGGGGGGGICSLSDRTCGLASPLGDFVNPGDQSVHVSDKLSTLDIWTLIWRNSKGHCQHQGCLSFFHRRPLSVPSSYLRSPTVATSKSIRPWNLKAETPSFITHRFLAHLQRFILGDAIQTCRSTACCC